MGGGEPGGVYLGELVDRWWSGYGFGGARLFLGSSEWLKRLLSAAFSVLEVAC